MYKRILVQIVGEFKLQNNMYEIIWPICIIHSIVTRSNTLPCVLVREKIIPTVTQSRKINMLLIKLQRKIKSLQIE